YRRTLFALPFFVLAYDDSTTHPGLTQEIVKFFNQSFPDLKISSADAELIIQGSIDEDSGIRWMHHFYDPVYKRGLVLGQEWMSSKEWSQNTMAQAGLNHRMMAGTLKSYFGGEDDYSWDRAIYEYAWGDRERGLKALGHILHLLEDATVPDHTRNDPHPPVLDMGSPYEGWTKRFGRASIRTSGLDQLKPILLASINDYFEALAKYSNGNFFSKDTIKNSGYREPTVYYFKNEQLSNGVSYRFAYAKENYKLFRIDKVLEWRDFITDREVTVYLQDNDNLILTDYWILLSKQAVMYGAGAVQLFFDEVEKEKETQTLYDKNRSWLAKKVDEFKKGMFGVATTLYGSSVRLEDLEETPKKSGIARTQEGASIVQAIQEARETAPDSALVPQQPDSTQRENQNSVPPAPTPIAAFVSPAQAPRRQAARTQVQISATQPAFLTLPPFVPSNTSVFVPFAGGGGESRASEEAAARKQESKQTASPSPSPSPSAPAPAPDATAPNAPIISSPADNQTFTTASITFTGIAEAFAIVNASFSTATTSANATGEWSLALSGFSQGTTTIFFAATDSAQNTSSTTPITFFVDSASPDITLAIAQCDTSLSPDACLVATTTIALAWSSGASDVKNYSIECEVNGSPCPNFNFSQTLATTTPYIAPNDNAIYTFRAQATDAAGNRSAQETKTVEIATRPLVINEIAWAGTSAARSEDEWIELYNPTSRTLNLSGITLRSETDNKPNIALSGAIGPRNFYLIERTDETTISDITASTTAPFGSGSGSGLSNSGETLVLEYASTTLDKTPALGACNPWCGGSTGTYYTMERYNPSASGEDPTNWRNTENFVSNGLNADGMPINGTPGRRNSLNYLIILSGTSATTTLTKVESPYIVPNDLVISSDKTLLIEPGVVVKFYTVSGAITVNGVLRAEGTAENPIVFTSFKDDSYGGDTNQDAEASSPQAGDWGRIKILGEGSLIRHAIVRYGGNYDTRGMSRALLRVENASTTVANSVFEYSGGYGVFYRNASGTFRANNVRNNRALSTSQSTGMFAEHGTLDIIDNTFSNNHQGLLLTSTGTIHSMNVSGNTFSQNASYAAALHGALPLFSGNTASENGINGINFQGSLNSQAYTLTPGLPYVIQNTAYNVAADSVLTIAPGVVIKLQGVGAMTIRGTLNARGTASQKIVFTSLYDDEYGGDTDGSTASPRAGDWHSIFFSDGSATSTLDNVVIRYGGPTVTVFPPRGALRIENAHAQITNATIEKNYLMGVWMKNSTASVAHSLVQDHLTPSAPEPGYGMFLTENSRLTLQNTTIKNNRVGIQADGSSSVLNLGGNAFEGNTTTTSPANLVQ
ncbi:MAG: right-handed parallel beta-helix repeat-containing protein, partial [Candidatus Sungbacteria bacterium]|nr:right-handed parallel beta-helix repeat-containing protein [Candidatus Sungbacteria bacterium]